MYAIPLFLYVKANTPEEARIAKDAIEKLLAQPIVKSLIGQQIPNEGFRVMDPQQVSK